MKTKNSRILGIVAASIIASMPLSLLAESLADRRQDISVEQWYIIHLEELIANLPPTAAGSMVNEQGQPLTEEEIKAMEKIMRVMALPEHRREWPRPTGDGQPLRRLCAATGVDHPWRVAEFRHLFPLYTER